MVFLHRLILKDKPPGLYFQILFHLFKFNIFLFCRGGSSGPKVKYACAIGDLREVLPT